MAIVIRTTAAIAKATQALRIALYGPERSGKTTFAATFPAPILLLPELCENEASVLGDESMHCITYGSLSEALDVCKLLEKEVKNGYKRTGGFLTVIVDNLTAAYQMWLHELENKPESKSGFHIWGEVHRTHLEMYRILHRLTNTNIIWIVHDRERIVQEKLGNRTTERRIGEFSVQGKAFTDVIAKTCMLLHSEVIRTETKELYRVWLKKHDIWKAGGWFMASQKAARTLDYIGMPNHKQPHYDVLAKVLGLPTAEQQEHKFFEE